MPVPNSTVRSGSEEMLSLGQIVFFFIIKYSFESFECITTTARFRNSFLISKLYLNLTARYNCNKMWSFNSSLVVFFYFHFLPYQTPFCDESLQETQKPLTLLWRSY